MKRVGFIVVLFLATIRLDGAGAMPADDRVTLIVVTGIAGAAEYETVFAGWSEYWREAGERSNALVYAIGGGDQDGQTDKEVLHALLETEVNKTEGQLWLVLNGHGTFDGEIGKFNLVGPDVSAEELAEWLKPCQRPVAVVNGFSASAPFIHALSAPNRVILSATKSGYELNYSRFGDYVSQAIGNLEADLDKDGQVSLLEAFLKGARDTEEYYSLDGRLASEHALIDDTGDQRGTSVDWYRGVRVIKKSKEGAEPDGRRAHQFHLIRSEFEQHMPKAARDRRDALELKVLSLRDRKESFEEAAYYAQLEEMLIELSEVYAEVEALMASSKTTPNQDGADGSDDCGCGL
ncbi:MAG: hypothetical protein M2R45_04490 [Verrucomicrobia subdivision 3 bacterium]|nr:hypothetical protein [Limisphaerales bacterium]MCS1412666.1 hypothetical protein [Limisphaerales bacterium]